MDSNSKTFAASSMMMRLERAAKHLPNTGTLHAVEKVNAKTSLNNQLGRRSIAAQRCNCVPSKIADIKQTVVKHRKRFIGMVGAALNRNYCQFGFQNYS